MPRGGPARQRKGCVRGVQQARTRFHRAPSSVCRHDRRRSRCGNRAEASVWLCNSCACCLERALASRGSAPETVLDGRTPPAPGLRASLCREDGRWLRVRRTKASAWHKRARCGAGLFEGAARCPAEGQASAGLVDYWKRSVERCAGPGQVVHARAELRAARLNEVAMYARADACPCESSGGHSLGRASGAPKQVRVTHRCDPRGRYLKPKHVGARCCWHDVGS